MLELSFEHQDLINEINDIKINNHGFILTNLDSLGESIEEIFFLSLNKKDEEDLSSISLIKELYKQLKYELIAYFKIKEKNIFDDILDISNNGIEGFSGTSGLLHMINNSYDDFHIYIIDIQKMLDKLNSNLFNEDIFINLDMLRKNIEILLKKENGLLDRLFRIMINKKQQKK